MSTAYGISPLAPDPEGPGNLEEWRIDPAEYERKLLEQWPLAVKSPGIRGSVVSYRLNRRSADGIRWIGEEIRLMSDLQSIHIDGPPSVEFVLWHRAFVPRDFRLYIWCAEDDELDAEITPDVTLAELADILGADSIGDPQVIFHISTQDTARADTRLRLSGTGDWRTYHSAEIDTRGYVQCADAQQVRRLANALHRGEHGLVLMWLFVDFITSPIDYVELPGLSTPGETFPRIIGSLDGMAIQRVLPYEPGPDGLFPWPEDIDEI